MTKINLETERLKFEIQFLRKQIDKFNEDPGDLPCMGCSSHSCIVKRPSGMATNGGCDCNDRELRRAVQWYKRKTKFLQETIKNLTKELKLLTSQANTDL